MFSSSSCRLCSAYEQHLLKTPENYNTFGSQQMLLVWYFLSVSHFYHLWMFKSSLEKLGSFWASCPLSLIMISKYEKKPLEILGGDFKAQGTWLHQRSYKNRSCSISLSRVLPQPQFLGPALLSSLWNVGQQFHPEAPCPGTCFAVLTKPLSKLAKCVLREEFAWSRQEVWRLTTWLQVYRASRKGRAALQGGLVRTPKCNMSFDISCLKKK